MVEDNGAFKAATREAEAIDRETLIKMMSDVSKQMYVRISAARFKERAVDDTYLKYIRSWSGLMQALTAALKDSDLIELEKRISALEEPEKTKEICYE